MTLLTLETPRLLLRPWRDDDVDAFAAMFDDPKVMAFLMPPRGRVSASADADRAAIDAIVGRVRAHFDRHGFGWWAAELKQTGAFIGFIGLSHIGFEAHFTPAVEIGWRLASVHWGKGYAHRRRARVAGSRLHAARARGDRLPHRAGQHALAPRHGTHRHDARSHRRLRSPAPRRGRSAAPARALPHRQGAVGAARYFAAVSEICPNPAATLRPCMPSTLAGCKAIWSLLPPTRTLAPSPRPTAADAVAPA